MPPKKIVCRQGSSQKKQADYCVQIPTQGVQSPGRTPAGKTLNLNAMVQGIKEYINNGFGIKKDRFPHLKLDS